jgi:PAS domain S-box-containing protein
LRGKSESSALAYLVTLLVTALAVLLRWILDPTVGEHRPLATLYGAVAVGVWVGGYRPALLAVAVGYLSCAYLFIEPRGMFGLDSSRNLAGLILYLSSCAVIIALGEAMRNARRRADQQDAALRTSIEQLKIVTDSMSALVTRCTRDLRYEWVSKRYADWMGLKQEEIVGRPIVDIFGNEAFEHLLPHFRRVLAGEGVQYEEEVTYREIGCRHIRAVYTPTFDARGAVDGWVAVVDDITEQKRLENSLKEADRRKSEFLATLAHELRNPLAPIRNAIQILMLKGPPDPELQRFREMINRQVQHMARLLDDLLDVSRISYNKLELRKERVELTAVIQSALETSRPLIDSGKHDLMSSCPLIRSISTLMACVSRRCFRICSTTPPSIRRLADTSGSPPNDRRTG